MSDDRKEQPVEYIFRAKTKEAFVIKILGELLANTIRFSPIKINEKGITLTQADANTEILVDIMLQKENFSSFKCTKPLSFMVNSGHFHKMLRNIKKKDTITMYITEDDPSKLGICIEKTDENNKTTTTIRISNNRPEQFNLPDGYDNPIIMSVKEFQQIKALHNISRTVTVSSRPGYIRFFCDGGELWTRDVVHNDNTDEDTENKDQLIIQNFHTHYLTGLTKCAGAGQSSNVQVFVNSNLPLKIKMRAGNLGDLTIFIKSKEMIEWEDTDNPEEHQEVNEGEEESAE
jgi:proliferating cell nuclear antigen PCNA